MNENNGSELQSTIREIRGITGINFSQYKSDFFLRCVQKRMQSTGTGSIDEYLRLFRADREETARFLETFTVYHSQFMRDPGKYAALKDHVLPELMQRTGRGRLRIWSAGCAAGEEPYSIAMVVKEALEKAGGNWQVEITATDLNEKLLEKARAGVYGEEELRKRDVNPYYLGRYFDELPGALRVKDEIRRMVRFERGNLITDSVRRGLDVIFCRNVLIYFSLEATRKIQTDFYNGLNSGGFLFLGNSEVLDEQFYTSFRKVKVNGEFIYRKVVPGSEEHRELVEKQKHIKAALGDNNGLSAR